MDGARDLRLFKSAWFARAARRAGISDAALRQAVLEVLAGRAEDLGGGVFKKRLADNRHRAIILARGGRCWVYQYLFAKQDRANIDADELRAFRDLAKAYSLLDQAKVEAMVRLGDWIEIPFERLE
jgi:hypothetical protein